MMLQIRPEQYEIFREIHRDRYVIETRKLLRREWSQRCAELDDQQLEELVRRARDKAESYGFEIVGDIVMFTESCLLLGDDFDKNREYPWAAEILTAGNMDATVKAATIRYRTMQSINQPAKGGRANG